MPQKEIWLKGAVADVPALLQPVAHALLQAREEVDEIMHEFPNELLWQKPAGVASAGFHLQHLSGILDRLFTYTKGEALSAEQLDVLAKEGSSAELTADDLVLRFHEQVNISIACLKQVDEKTLTHQRGVGRKQLPSTVSGLLFHAAEHTMRHIGQLMITVRVLKAGLH